MYPDLPAPTFNESVFGAANGSHSDSDSDSDDEKKFVPRYVTYNTYN